MDALQENMQENKLKKSNTWKIIAIIAGVVGLLFIISAITFGLFIYKVVSGPSEVAEDFLWSVADGEYTEAFEMTHSEFQKGATVEGLQVFVESYPVIDDMTDLKFTYHSADGDLRISSGTIEGAGETLPITVQLLEEDDKWKVVFFSINPEDVPDWDEE